MAIWGTLPVQTVSAWKTSAPLSPCQEVTVEMVHVIVGGGGLPPPLGSQVSPHWNLGPMPPGAWAAGTAVKPAVVCPPAGVAAWAGAAPTAAASSPPPAVATAMAAAASALLKRDAMKEPASAPGGCWKLQSIRLHQAKEARNDGSIRR